MIRIVGLSATLPNYRDVGRFLGVNSDSGGWGGLPSWLAPFGGPRHRLMCLLHHAALVRAPRLPPLPHP